MRTVILPAEAAGFHIKFEADDGVVFFAGYGGQNEILTTKRLEESGILSTYKEAQAVMQRFQNDLQTARGGVLSDS